MAVFLTPWQSFLKSILSWPSLCIRIVVSCKPATGHGYGSSWKDFFFSLSLSLFDGLQTHSLMSALVEADMSISSTSFWVHIPWFPIIANFPLQDDRNVLKGHSQRIPHSLERYSHLSPWRASQNSAAQRNVSFQEPNLGRSHYILGHWENWFALRHLSTDNRDLSTTYCQALL